MLVYRIQPAGRDANHASEDSNGDCTSLHVFLSPLDAIHCQERPDVYGDEVVELEVGRVWDNGDVEGVACNGRTATAVRRWTLNEFAKWAMPSVAGLDADAIDCTLGYAQFPHWFAARNQ